MTKSIIFLVLVLLVIIVSFFGEFVAGQQQQQRPRSRSKVSSVKKKRITPIVTTTSPSPPVEITTIFSSITDDEEDETVSDDDHIEITTAPQSDLTELPQLIITQTTSTVGTAQKSSKSKIVDPDKEDEEEDDEVKPVPKKVPRKSLSKNSPLVRPGNQKSSAATVVSKAAMGCDEECDKDECPALGACPTGLVLDWCNCCTVCSVGEGNRCYDPSLKLSYNPDFGVCGPGLTCKLRSDLEPFDTPEALCECRDKRIVCGSDNQTYSSECKLRAEAAQSSNPSLVVASWKPCVSVPWIPTPVENVTVAEGEEVALSCEVKGFPSPSVHWEFLPDESMTSTTTKILPGDDSSVVVVIRGGPESMMTTSWLQIVGVTPVRQGKYFCIANNPEGRTQSSAFVSVYKNTE